MTWHGFLIVVMEDVSGCKKKKKKSTTFPTELPLMMLAVIAPQLVAISDDSEKKA